MNASPSELTPLEVALNRYQVALNYLDSSSISLDKEQVLEILSARDNLQKILESVPEIPRNLWSKLIEQDSKLKHNAYKIAEVIDLEDYRDSTKRGGGI